MITLVLTFHNHQPVGNFGWVFEEAYQKAYLPLMETIGGYPSIRFAQHYTGILLDWFAEHHPGFMDLIAKGVATDRVELLSGGFYEPILAMLPERDRQAQIIKLNRRIEAQFGKRPTGMWLAERVWEPSLPSTLHDAGLGYTILDDTHFKAAGLRDADLTGYFLTEDQGKPLAVFPIDKHLRYTMPFKEPEVTIEYLHSLDRSGEDRVVVFADDGEKFGIWPDTYQTVYQKRWLARFCELLSSNGSWLRTLPPGDVVKTMKPAGRLYLPTASYAEMLHWALPTAEGFTDYEKFEQALKDKGLADNYGAFVRGGFWRNFMVKYPEVNAMQKKMLRVSGRIDRLRGEIPEGKEEQDSARLNDAYDHLMASQCNCPYWHGVFGGIYLANIRAAIYREMISAETELDVIEGVHGSRIEKVDYNLDGYEEMIYENSRLALYLFPECGGGMYEFDYKPARYNFCDLVQRRKEGYHARLTEIKPAAKEAKASEVSKSIHDIVRVKEAGLERSLIYDGYRHGMLIDHFYGKQISGELLRTGKISELGDFVTGAYEVAVNTRQGGHTITLHREGKSGNRSIRVEKAISVNDDSPHIQVDYTVRSLDGKPLEGHFGVEMSYSMSAGTEPDRYYEIDGEKPKQNGGRLNGTGESTASRYALVDEWLKERIEVRLERPAMLLRAPIETVSLSEEGFERNYQGSVVVMVWDIKGATDWTVGFEQKIESIG